MSYWRKRLGDYIDILSGFAFKTKDFVDKGIPIIKIKNITPPSVTLDSLSYVTKEVAEQQKRFELSYDDVLIALTGSHINQMNSVVGRVARVKYTQKTLLNQRVGKITVIDSNLCDLDYVYYYLSQECVKIELAKKAGGAANQANISPTDVKNLVIPLPPIETQKKIADILSAYDDLIENNQKQIKLLEEVAQRLYKEWFIDLHFPGHESTPIIDGIPQGWEKKAVNNVVSLLSGFAFKSDDFDKQGKYKIVTIKNVQDGAFDGDNINRIMEVPSKMPKHCLLKDGDILLSLTGNVGRVCLVNGQNYLLNQRVAKLQSDTPAFAYCLFRSKEMFDEMNNLANGAAQQNLSPIRTGEVKVLVPNLLMQTQFENIAMPIISKMLVLSKQNIALKEARDRLLPKLMNGEIEVGMKKQETVKIDKFENIRKHWQNVPYDEDLPLAARSTGDISEETLEKLKKIAEEE